MFFNCFSYGENYILTGNDLKDRYDCGYWRYDIKNNETEIKWNKYNPFVSENEDVLHLSSCDCHRTTWLTGTWGPCAAVVAHDLTLIDPADATEG